MDDISKKLAQINSYIGKMENVEQDKRLKKVSRLVAIGVGLFLVALVFAFSPIGLFETRASMNTGSKPEDLPKVTSLPIDTLVVYVQAKQVTKPEKENASFSPEPRQESSKVVAKTPPSHDIEEASLEPPRKLIAKNNEELERPEVDRREIVTPPSELPSSAPVQAAVMRSSSSESPATNLPKIVGPVADPDVDPKFPGGRAALSMFIQKHVTYPKVDKEEQKEGTVFVRFTVDEMGTIKDPKIIKGLGEAYDKEALALIEKMPRWVPGKMQDKSIATYKDLGIMYKIY